MTLPNSNISTSLVGQTLGTSSRDVGTLCTHPNINKWSRWKPVRFNSVAGLTEDEFASSQNNFGLLAPAGRAASPETEYGIKTAVINASTQDVWTYVRPTGLSSDPFRLGDFRNYNPLAIPFIYVPPYVNNTINFVVSSTSTQIQIYPSIDVGDVRFNLTFNDFYDYSVNAKNYRLYGVITQPNKGAVIKTAISPNLMDGFGNVITDNLRLSFDVSDVPTSYVGSEYELYIALKDSSSHTYHALPKSEVYNNFPIKVIVDQSGVYDGINIKTPATDVAFDYPYALEYKYANQCTVEYGGFYTLQNDNGDLIMRVRINNESSNVKYLTTSDIRLNNSSNSYTYYPTAIDIIDLDGISPTPTQVALSANSTTTVFLHFAGILSGTTNPFLTLDYKVNTFVWRPLFQATLNYEYGMPSWV